MYLGRLGKRLGKAVDGPRFETMFAEFLQVFSVESGIQGIFGVGPPVGEAPTVDIKFRPSLSAMRAHALIKQHVGPALKRADASVQMWVPLSSA